MPSDNPAVDSLKLEQDAQRRAARKRGADGELHDALEGTFPASDPVSFQAPVTPGAPESKPDGDEAEAPRFSELDELLFNEVQARPLRALGWAVAVGFVLGFWAAK